MIRNVRKIAIVGAGPAGITSAKYSVMRAVVFQQLLSLAQASALREAVRHNRRI